MISGIYLQDTDDESRKAPGGEPTSSAALMGGGGDHETADACALQEMTSIIRSLHSLADEHCRSWYSLRNTSSSSRAQYIETLPRLRLVRHDIDYHDRC